MRKGGSIVGGWASNSCDWQTMLHSSWELAPCTVIYSSQQQAAVYTWCIAWEDEPKRTTQRGMQHCSIRFACVIPKVPVHHYHAALCKPSHHANVIVSSPQSLNCSRGTSILNTLRLNSNRQHRSFVGSKISRGVRLCSGRYERGRVCTSGLGGLGDVARGLGCGHLHTCCLPSVLPTPR